MTMIPAGALSLLSEEVRPLYRDLLAALRKMGPFEEEPKKTSIHLVRKSAFIGVAPRSNSLLITIKSAKPIRTPRVVKGEQVSKGRWHIEVRIASVKDIDAEFLTWARDAYELSA